MPAQAVRNYSGTVDYAGNRAILDDAGTRYVLLIDSHPSATSTSKTSPPLPICSGASESTRETSSA